MLGITRRRGESVHIGDDIVVRVLLVQGDSLRLGIEAPSNISVLRSELISHSMCKSGQMIVKEVEDKKKVSGRGAVVTYVRRKRLIRE